MGTYTGLAKLGTSAGTLGRRVGPRVERPETASEISPSPFRCPGCGNGSVVAESCPRCGLTMEGSTETIPARSVDLSRNLSRAPRMLAALFGLCLPVATLIALWMLELGHDQGIRSIALRSNSSLSVWMLLSVFVGALLPMLAFFAAEWARRHARATIEAWRARTVQRAFEATAARGGSRLRGKVHVLDADEGPSLLIVDDAGRSTKLALDQLRVFEGEREREILYTGEEVEVLLPEPASGAAYRRSANGSLRGRALAARVVARG